MKSFRKCFLNTSELIETVIPDTGCQMRMSQVLGWSNQMRERQWGMKIQSYHKDGRDNLYAIISIFVDETTIYTCLTQFKNLAIKLFIK